MFRARIAVAAVLVSSTALSGCSSSGGAALPPDAPATSTTQARPADDGFLRIGILLPSSGEGASIVGQSARAAVKAAVSVANAAGGINGHDVTIFVRDEGEDATTAALGLEHLMAANVDVIIGPASSNTAIALAPTMVSAGMTACSPSASALALDDFPDNRLFFRTIPSDSLQAEAMAKVIEQTGGTSAAVAYVDDGYGRPFEQALESRLRARGITVTDAIGFSIEDAEYKTEAQRLVASGSAAIALIGDPDAGSRMLAALADASSAEPRDIVVNDTLRQPWTLSLLGSVDAATRSHIAGVSPSVLTQDQTLLTAINAEDPAATGLFASQAYDCVNLYLLAALKTGSTQSAVLAAALPDISSVGSSCSTFVECSALIRDGRSIDYEGTDGLLALGANGDPISADYDQFAFDDQGRDVTVGRIIASSGGTS